MPNICYTCERLTIEYTNENVVFNIPIANGTYNVVVTNHNINKDYEQEIVAVNGTLTWDISNGQAIFMPFTYYTLKVYDSNDELVSWVDGDFEYNCLQLEFVCETCDICLNDINNPEFCGSCVIGDMLKSVYDTNDDGIVDMAAVAALANSVDWDNITNKPVIGGGDMFKSIYDTNDNTAVDIAETLRIEVINKTGSTVLKGKIVYIKSTSSSANHPEILLASATTEGTSSKTIGAVYDDIPNDGLGWVVLKGEVYNANTNAYNVGDRLWLSTVAGDVTTTPPVQPNHSVFIGHVTRKQQNNGRITYTIINGYEIGELHDVLFSNPQQFEILTYNGSLWVNNTIDNVLGYTPADDADLALKENLISTGTTSQYWRGDKTWQTLDKTSVGLSNVDNTSDANKPISTATQTALNAKQDVLVSGTNIKTLEGNSLLGSGNIDLSKSDVGLSNVDNTSDLNKPISTATQTALNGKENSISVGTTSQYFRGDKTWQTLDKNAIGLGNVDNTSDANKPISTATQTALNAKQDTLVSGTNIKTVEGQSILGSGNIDLSKSDVGLSNVDNTSDVNKPISTATQTALNAKQNTLTLTTTGTSGAATLIASTLNIPQYSGGGASYTFSTGLTNSSGTVTANLSTGVAGGQSVVGGINASNSLTLSSTSNATKGKILFGTSAYDEVNNRLGIGTASPSVLGDFQYTDNNFAPGIRITNSNIGNSASAAFQLVRADNTNAGLTIVNSNWNWGFANTAQLYSGVGVVIHAANTTASPTTNNIDFAIGNNLGTYNKARIFSNGNVLIQNGGTFTDAGFRLDVNGSTRVQNQLTVTAGTLVQTTKQYAVHVTATMPASYTYSPQALFFDITSSGSQTNDFYPQLGMRLNFNAGYTGGTATAGAWFLNFAAGTAGPATGFILSGLSQGNSGMSGFCAGNTTGYNYGFNAFARLGNLSIGGLFRAGFNATSNNKNGATYIGCMGVGRNDTATNSKNIGGYFGLNNTDPLFVSAALIADNGDAAVPIFIARDNGSVVWQILDGGDTSWSDGKNLQFAKTTGTKIGTANDQKLSFWNATPIIQPTTGVADAAKTAGAGASILIDDKFDGYTIPQIVKALRNTGLLA